MDFQFTPEEALPIARKLVEHLIAKGESVHVELPAWNDTPYRTTFFSRRSGETILYEVQGQVNFHRELQGFAHWIGAQRHYAELQIVGSEDCDVSASVYPALQKAGVGLILAAANGTFNQVLRSQNPALIVRPEPTLRYGSLKKEVAASVQKFNDGARKDGLRDLCELVEGQTQAVLLQASTRGWLKPSAKDINGMDWSDQINTLASKNAIQGDRNPIIDDKLKTDLHSFRGARNLLDHNVKSKADEVRRQRQFAERMMMGARLCADLTATRRKIR